MRCAAVVPTLAAAIAMLTGVVSASGPLGIYGIVERVVFEPDARAPQRIQVWGAFAYSEVATPALSSVQRGYLYFRLPDGPDGVRETDLRVRPAAEAPATPAPYQTSAGVVKLSANGSHAAIVKQLRAALTR
jgi:hypothetical protein